MGFSQDQACRCPRCGLLVPISLPLPILEQITKSLTGSVPMGRIHPPIFFACPKCAAVWPCTVADLRLLSLEIPDLRLDQLNICLIVARRPCGRDKCEFLAEIHTIVPNGTKLEGLLRIAETWNFRALVCPECHRLLRDSLAGEYTFEGVGSPEN